MMALQCADHTVTVKKVWRFLVLIPMAITAVAVSRLVGTSDPEPTYQGRPLGYWLAQNPALAFPAVQSMGTNAIVPLLRMLRMRNSHVFRAMTHLVERQQILKFRIVPAEIINARGEYGFQALGSMGRDAVPELISIFETKISDSSMHHACRSLAYIGPDAGSAIPSLLQMERSADLELHCEILWALGSIHSRSEISVPALIASLHEADERLRQHAALSLGQFCADAQAAVPALVNALSDENQHVRNYARVALARIDPVVYRKATSE